MPRRATEERSEGFQARFSEAPPSNASEVDEPSNPSANNGPTLPSIETPSSTTMEPSSQIIEALAARMEELEARLLQQDRGFTPGPALSTSSERSRVQKIPDPPLFSDGKEPTWEDWHGKVKDKLSINADSFPNEQSKLGYVFSRLAGLAARATRAQRNSDSINLYKTAKEVLKELADIFDNPNKEENIRREYEELT